MSLKRIVVMISGGGSNLQAVIDAVETKAVNAEITGVIASRPDAYGLVRAGEANIPAQVISRKDFKSAADFDAANLNTIRAFKPDLIILAGYLAMIGAPIVEAFRNRIINIHPSLIPAFCGKGYYGEKVHQAVLDYGARFSGATTHFVDEGADTGPVIMQKTVPVLDGDTAKSLARRVLDAEHEILVKSAALFCDDRLEVSGRKVTVLD